jgi:hypothetical protein
MFLKFLVILTSNIVFLTLHAYIFDIICYACMLFI